MEDLRPIYERAISHYREFRTEPWVVNPSIPILYFGDLRAYAASALKIVTVGLNPSNVEFEGQRFGIEVQRSLEPDTLEQALCGYFQLRPYCRWFNRAFETLLQPLGASFYGARYPSRHPRWWRVQPNTALHTDIGTPLATDPTWSKLARDAKARLRATGRPLWMDLIEALKPDLILISVAPHHLELLGNVSWRSFKPFPSVERRHEMRIGWLGRSAVVWGQAQVTPFFHLTNEQRTWAAPTILKEAGLL
ncbi:MAG: hypothetical protein WCA78_15485 [Rhizomicrobium sp.]